MSAMTRDKLTLGPFARPLTREQMIALTLMRSEFIDAGCTVMDLTTPPVADGEPGQFTMTVVAPPEQPPIERAAPIAVERDR